MATDKGMGVYKGRMSSVVIGEKPVNFFILKSTKTLKNFGNCRVHSPTKAHFILKNTLKFTSKFT